MDKKLKQGKGKRRKEKEKQNFHRRTKKLVEKNILHISELYTR